MRNILTRPAFALALLLSLLAHLASAQSTTGSISGNVTDPSGGAIAGATVTIADPARNFTRTIETTEDGNFNVAQLQPGTYTVTIEQQGFKRFEQTGVVVTAAANVDAGKISLEIGDIGEVVSVVADAGQLQLKSESGERSELISNTQIRDLALNGRNVLDLVKTIPGVVTAGNNTNQVSQTTGADTFNINGTRGRSHEISVDGTSNVDAGDNGGLHVTINPDAIAEVRVLTSNYQAEYGKAAGGTLLFVTKSGTNEFHGTGRYFRRHDSLNANTFENNARGRRADGSLIAPRPLYRYDYYGYDFSGPIYLPRSDANGKPAFVNNKNLFFFFSQEFYRQLIPQGAREIRVPTALERAGDFSQTRDGNGAQIFLRDPTRTGTCTAANTVANPGACFVYQGRLNVIDPARFARDGQAILNIYPLPNFSGNGFRSNFLSQLSDTFPRREDILRVDYNFNDSNRLTFRGINNADERVANYGLFSGFLGYNFPKSQGLYRRPGRNVNITLFNTLSPTLTNEFIFGASKNLSAFDFADDAFTRAANNITQPSLFPAANEEDLIPNFVYGGIPAQTFPATSFNPIPFSAKNTVFNITDNTTKIAGNHTLKGGIFIQRNRKDQAVSSSNTGTVSFTNDNTNPLNTGHPFANALVGNYFSYTQPTARPLGFIRYTNVEGYLQDTWRIRPNLTLDYGLRVGYYQPTFDERLQNSVFNPALFDPARAPRLFTPVLVGTTRRAVDPATASQPGFTPTAANTLAASFIGLIVPNSGDLANGFGVTRNGYPRGGFEGDGALLEPRIGFAYSPGSDQKTVIRGGFGIAHDRLAVNYTLEQLSNPPQVFQPTLFFGRLDEISSTSGFLAPSPVVGFSPDFDVPTVYSYSLGIQRDIGFNTVVDVAYVGNVQRHLLLKRDLNAAFYGTTFQRSSQDPSRFTGGGVPTVEPGLPAAYSNAGYNFSGQFALPDNFLRPYRGYGQIDYRESVGTANYNSLQVSANRRFSRGLSLGVAYTFSKTLTTGSQDTSFVNPFFTRDFEYRLADFDRTHVFVANYVYDIPRLSRFMGGFGENRIVRAIFDNYQISGVTNLSSGVPVEFAVALNGANAQQRINGAVGGPGLGIRYLYNGEAQRSGSNIINTDAILLPAIGQPGRGVRNNFRGPGINQTDLALFKNFPFGSERSRNLQLRFEAFNVFNHTQFQGVQLGGINLPISAVIAGGGTQSLTSFVPQRGTSTAVQGSFFGELGGTGAFRDPRIIQLAAKLYF